MSALVVQAFENDLPCGSEYKYEDAYVLIETEIDKSTSVSSETGTDWQVVVSGAEAILSEHSKDFKLASWWLFGRWQLEALDGLQRALPVFTQFLQTFTTSLYPSSMKVKKRTAAWLEAALSDALMADEEGLLALQNPQEFLEQLQAAEAALQQACTDDAYFCRKVQRVLERRADEAQKEEKQQSAAAPESEEPKKVVVAPQPQVTAPNTENDVPKILQSIKKSADMVARFRRQERFADTLAIRLNRLQSWLEVDELPMNDGGKTMLNPPSEASMEEINEMIAAQEYASAFEKLEGILKFSLFWFDGHHMAYELLSRAGEEAAALEVKQALLHFTGLYPETLEYTFNDGTPFASKTTRIWLSAGVTTVVMEAAVAESEDDRRDAQLLKIRSMIKKNSIKEAMGVLQSCYQQAEDNMQRFQWRLSHAEIAVECGKKEIALALLEDLEAKIGRHRLDEWHPDLAAQVYVLYLNAFNRTQVALEKLDAIYGRLCKIDSTLAVDIKY